GEHADRSVDIRRRVRVDVVLVLRVVGHDVTFGRLEIRLPDLQPRVRNDHVAETVGDLLDIPAGPVGSAGGGPPPRFGRAYVDPRAHPAIVTRAAARVTDLLPGFPRAQDRVTDLPDPLPVRLLRRPFKRLLLFRRLTLDALQGFVVSGRGSGLAVPARA